jgi:hypothetical protein
MNRYRNRFESIDKEPSISDSIVTKPPEKMVGWIRDRKKLIPDPGVKKAPDPDPQHCFC